MKQLKFFGMFLSMLMGIIALTSCGGDDKEDEPATSLAGSEWYVTQTNDICFEDDIVILEFSQDGVGVAKNPVGKNLKFTYVTYDDVLNIIIEDAWFSKGASRLREIY